MNFFISDAMAQTAGAPQGGGLMSFVPLVVIFVIFYFLLIRPQSKRTKEHKAMLEAIAKGDEVVTNGGILGKVKNVGESFVTIEIADNTTIKIQKQALATLMPKGTIKSS
ncbi:MAG: preprotein translocase subunit YajC [bacterium]